MILETPDGIFICGEQNKLIFHLYFLLCCIICRCLCPSIHTCCWFSKGFVTVLQTKNVLILQRRQTPKIFPILVHHGTNLEAFSVHISTKHSLTP